MAITRIQNNQITDATIVAYAKVAAGSLTGNLFAPTVTLNSNVTINGNLFLSNTGNVTTINATNTYINDPLVMFNNGYTGSLTGYDIGILINRNLASLGAYGSVNTFLGWVEADSAFETLATTDTGTGVTSINNAGWANFKTGNLTALTATTGGLQAAAIGNVTPGTAVFTTATTGGLQAVAIGNATPGTGAFTTGTFSSTLGVTGATTMTTATTGGLQAVAIGNVTPGTGTFTTGGFTGNATTSYLFSNVGTTSLTIAGNAISSNTGIIGLGGINNVGITGGASGYTVTTNGLGVLSFNPANVLILGANSTGQLSSNAISLTNTTNVTDAIAQLNQILGKLTPAAPPNFPGNVATSVGAASTFTITTGTTSGIMTGDSARGSGWTQKNNIAGNTYQLAGGTTFNAIRSNVYATSTLAAIKSGSGNVVVYLGGNIVAGSYVLTGSLGTVSNGNLTITNDTDYNNIKSTVAAGFWYSANISASGSSIPEGWNTVTISEIGGYSTGNTNALLWYNDVSTVNVGTPTYSNTSITMTTNTVVYSSTIPHLTSGATFRLKGNLANLSGDTYSGNTNVTSSTGSGGAFNAPTAVTWSGTVGPAGYAGTVPLPRYFCNATYGGAYNGTLYYETSATVLASGFGSSANGPTLTVTNNYNAAATATGTASPTGFAPGVTVLYKNGTSVQIEETSIPVNSVGTGSGNGYRILNPGSTNNPAYTGSEAAFNSQTSTLTTTDAINIGSGSQGIIAWSQTNYSTGYLPVGPNLSGQAATQYFTMKFIRTAVSKFDVKYTGTIAGLWIALPGLSESASYGSATNGWFDMGTAYAGAGTPGTGGSANGSAGCAVGGVAVFNSAQSAKSVTGTFGALSSSSSTNNEIYVRVALTSGQSLTALTMEAATH